MMRSLWIKSAAVALLALSLPGPAWAEDSVPKKKAVAPAKTAKAKPQAAAAADPLLTAAETAVKTGDAAQVRAANDAITAARMTFPAWVQDKTQAASAVPADKQRALALWNKLHQASLAAVAKGDMDRALDTGTRAYQTARDNLGADHMATVVSATDLGDVQLRAGKIEDAEASYKLAVTAADTALGAGHPEAVKVRTALVGFYTSQMRLADA
jgi:hypothetical protein